MPRGKIEFKKKVICKYYYPKQWEIELLGEKQASIIATKAVEQAAKKIKLKQLATA